MSYIKGFNISFLHKPKQTVVPVENRWSKKEIDIIQNLISNLLQIGAISAANYCIDQYVSNIFTIRKPNGSYRLILNLKNLNQFIRTTHFKIEGNKIVSRLIFQNCFMSTIDLKDAYYLIPINSSHRKYLRFKFNSTLYEYNCLPFGLNCAPLVFTKILKPVVKLLRQKGVLLVVYLDDFLILGKSYDECEYNVTLTLKLLTHLGFLINYAKCSLIPNNKCTFLGFNYNSQNLTRSLPEEKQIRIGKMLRQFSCLSQCKIRDFSKIIGTLVSACPAIKYGFLHIKILERYKYIALKQSNGNYNKTLKIAQEILISLSWFINKIPNSINQIRINSYHIEIFTDASNSGWGAYHKGQSAFGFWSKDEKKFHINYLELLALYFGLRCFASDFINCNILCRVDNTTAVACINKMGSVRFISLNEITQKIWSWCEERYIFIFASYINTKENIEADNASRQVHKETEWSLSNDSFQHIVKKFGQPVIDLFASRINKKCSTFISWMRDPDAYKIDAFTLSWNTLNFYAFPPFSMVLRMLQKIIDDKAEGIVVVPFWISQPWYPIFKALLVDEPIIFKPNRYLLSFDRTPHPLWQDLSLVAGKLSGKRYYKEMCQGIP